MITPSKSIEALDKKAVLSTLWIFLAVNYIYCDHLGNMEPGAIKGLLAGQIGNLPVTQEFLLAAALTLQIPFLMIVLSRVLKVRVNRWVNIIAATIMIIIQVATMGMGIAPSLVYLFYSAIEIACNLFIIWYAWRWTNPES
jgi:hypothetical protein